MRGVAYTGNNMKKRQKSSVENFTPIKFEMKQVFHKYPEKKREKLREKSAMIKTFSAIPKSRQGYYFGKENKYEPHFYMISTFRIL